MKPADRVELMRDADYFAGELSRRLEALADIEPSGHVLEDWTQAAKLARTVRGLVRRESDLHRRRERLARREAA